MPLSAFLQGITSIASVLPASIYGLIALWQARSVLQKFPERAAAAAQKGIEDLERKEITTSASAINLGYSPALKAALRALLATAQKRIGSDTQAQENFKIADSAFAKLLYGDRSFVAPFLSDYLFMLVEFGAGQRALHVAENVSEVAQTVTTQNQGGAPSTWLRAAMLSPTPGMVMELGSLLRSYNDLNAAYEAFMYSAGIAFASDDDVGIASEAIENALAIFPNSGDARRVRGLLRWRAGEIQGAQEDFAAAVTTNPADIESRVALAHSWIKLGKPKQALEESIDVLSRDRTNVDAIWLRGEAELRIGEAERSEHKDESAHSHWESAIASLTEALSQRPEHAACRRSRAIAYYRVGKLSDAINDLDEALSSDPNDVEGHGWRAAVLLKRNEDAKALSAVNVALSLIGSNRATDEKRAWLLGMKGQALLRTAWLDQAIDLLTEATDLDPSNEEAATNLLQAYRDQQDWKGLAQRAHCLQSNGYSPNLLSRLRRDETGALRNMGNYEAAFEAIGREPRPSASDPDMIWLRARLFVDIGDFEAARDAVPEASRATPRAVDHLSLRGWIIQNIDAWNSEHRAALGKEAHRLYSAALDFARDSPNRSDMVWLRKGLANALLRSDLKDQAFQIYREVISECEQHLRSAAPAPRILALIGWCYHCLEDHSMALRYYAAAVDKGEQSVGVALDYGLVLSAAQGGSVEAGQSGLDRYWSALAKARRENVLRRIGLVRVALHDVKELLFRKPGLVFSREIKQLLDAELRQAIETAQASLPATLGEIHTFLNRLKHTQPNLVPDQRKALKLRMEGLVVNSENPIGALKLLHKAAQIYAQTDENVWAALTWRDIALVFTRLEDADKSCRAAWDSLKAGLYVHDLQSSCSFLTLITRHALSRKGDLAAYRSLIRTVFLTAGPERAYLDAPKIVAAMSPDEQRLFAETILALFPPKYDYERIYGYKEGQTWTIPNNDRIFGPFRRYLRPETFAQVKEATLAKA